MNLKGLTVIAMATCFATAANAEERSGLYLSGGVGVQTSTISGEYNGSEYFSTTNNGYLSSFKIGAYLNPNVAVYAVHEGAWWFEETDNDDPYVAGLAGVGITYYVNEGNSTLFEAAVGLSHLHALEDSDIKHTDGIAGYVGVGREFMNHFQITGVVMAGEVEDRDDSDYSYKNVAVGLKLEAKL